MTAAYWKILIEISELVARDGRAALGEKTGGMLAAVSETVADILPTASAKVLREGMAEAALALAKVKGVAQVNRNSPDFVAGQLAAITDILGYAASVTADEDEVNKATQPPYVEILTALASDALRNVDLGDRLGKDEAYVSRLLDHMRSMGVVTSHRRGREVFNTLTPVGQLLSGGGQGASKV